MELASTDGALPSPVAKPQNLHGLKFQVAVSEAQGGGRGGGGKGGVITCWIDHELCNPCRKQAVKSYLRRHTQILLLVLQLVSWGYCKL